MSPSIPAEPFDAGQKTAALRHTVATASHAAPNETVVQAAELPVVSEADNQPEDSQGPFIEDAAPPASIDAPGSQRRAENEALVSQLTPERLAEFKASFALLDKDGDGVISSIEIGRLMCSLGQNPTEEDIKVLLSSFFLATEALPGGC
jgi:hypothetical protein